MGGNQTDNLSVDRHW